jgi:hypothetical protein
VVSKVCHRVEESQNAISLNAPNRLG